ncbi:hypothetical protein [Occultella kanbiaonis]|uniref:hypothetical protein n=1 Tax=Occultella kanbiaonis TaxID=2675754 RepID=UPI0012B85F58|nr:hypothetical protein [Occultella kanbiaonis]
MAVDAGAEDDVIELVGTDEFETNGSNQPAAPIARALTVEEIFALYPDCPPPGSDFSAIPIGCPLVAESGTVAMKFKAGNGDGELVPATEALTLTVTDFQRLLLAGSEINLQPQGEWTLVNMDTIVFTDGATQEFSTTVLGLPVAVRATPVEFTWDFGDGSAPLVTTEAGAGYPDHTLTHVYTTTETVEITLTTSWSGEFQINGTGPWLAVNGTATTVTVSDPLRVETAETNLVP